MWRTRYPITCDGIPEHCRAGKCVADGPTVDNLDPWAAYYALQQMGVQLPREDDTMLVDGADGATIYVASVADGKWYAAFSEV